jgi:hypothetical protein
MDIQGEDQLARLWALQIVEKLDNDLGDRLRSQQASKLASNLDMESVDQLAFLWDSKSVQKLDNGLGDLSSFQWRSKLVEYLHEELRQSWKVYWIDRIQCRHFAYVV